MRIVASLLIFAVIVSLPATRALAKDEGQKGAGTMTVEFQPPKDGGLKTLAATALFFLHEMGHAFIDLMEIPITGKEEDAVDDLAALTLIEAEEDEPADSSLYSVVDAFDDLSADYGDIDELPMWDEHSLTQQRLYSMLCVLYGSNAKAHGDLVGEGGLPKERAVRCASEYKQKRDSWSTLLDDYLKE